MSSKKHQMRLAGLYYLAFIGCTFAADFMASFALNDSDSVIQKLLSNDLVFRMGVSFNLLSALFFVLAAWGLYVLLQDSGRNLALLFLVLNAVGAAIQSLSSIFLFSATALVNDTAFTALTGGSELTVILKFLISAYDNAFMSSQLFFSTWLLPLGILVYRSRILPRILGVLLIVDFVGILFWFFQHLLVPNARAFSYPALVVSIAAEFGLTFFLLFRRAKFINETESSIEESVRIV